MRVLLINSKIENKTRINFKAINLSDEEKQTANKILMTNPVTNNPDELNEKLFLIFDKHIQNEARLKAKNTYNFVDVLQNMYMEFIQALNNNEQKENKLENIIETLNNYKPGKQDLKDGVDRNTVSLQESIYTSSKDGDELYLEDTITEEDLPVPLSQQSEEEREASVKKIQELTTGILNEREQYIVKQRTMGFTCEQIAKDVQLSYSRTERIYLSAITKIKREKNALPKEYANKARELKERFSLEQSIDELIDIMIDWITVFTLDIDKIENNVNNSSKLLNIERKEFIKVALKHPQLFYSKPETINQNMEDGVKLLGIEKEEFIKIANYSPSLFCRKPETLNQKVNTLSELFEMDRLEIVQQIIKNPVILTRSSEGLKLIDEIYRYYLKLQNKEIKKKAIKTYSFSLLYSDILAFLINKEENAHIVITKSIQTDLKNFLKEYDIFKNPEYFVTFKVPDDPVLERFIKFTENLANETIGRNPFKFKKIYEIENDVLKEEEQDIVKKITNGSKYTDIAKDMQISMVAVKNKFLSAIAKLQKRIGTLPKEYNEWANALKERFSLEQSIEELIDMLIDNPVLLTKDIDEIENKVNDTSEILSITREEAIKMRLKYPEFFSLDPKETDQKIDNYAKLLGITREESLKTFRIMPLPFEYKTETLEQKINDTCELVDITKEEAKKLFRTQASLFCQKPETIKQKVKDISKLLGISEEDTAKIVVKQPGLLTQSSELLNQKIDKLAELFEIDRAIVIQKIINNPSFLTKDPQTVKFINDILLYYKKLMGKKHEQITFVGSSIPREYSKVLAYLLNKKAKMKLVPITGSIQKDLKNFLKGYEIFKNPDYSLTFEVPDDPVVEGLIEFTENFTTDTIGRNPFKFNILPERNQQG